MGDYVVLDLEMCKLPKGYKPKEFKHNSEIIQIGAVLIDDTYKIVDKYAAFVKPQYGELDAHISHLTGINKGDIKDAPLLDVVIREFEKWIPKDAVLVSWSETDLYQLRYEFEDKNIALGRFEKYFETWVDCQKKFSERLESSRPYNLEEALIIADIIPEGRAHNGLDDAYNTGLLYIKMLENSQFELNKLYLESKNEAHETLSFSMGDLFSNIKLD